VQDQFSKKYEKQGQFSKKYEKIGIVAASAFQEVSEL
jgi:hypothetical protein